MSAPHPIFLAGPTAVGKSAVAMELARRTGGEIVSVDSMQVYRGMDIGTAKASPDERDEIRHHLLDVVGVHERFAVADFLRLAHETVSEMNDRGVVPIFCGGTGLYFRTFFEGLGSAPPGDPKLRETLEATDLDALLAELKTLDPAAWNAIDRNNRRRVVRAVEVCRLTGRPFSELRAAWREETGDHAPIFALRRSTDDLRARIDRRVERMFDQGLVDETRRLMQEGLEGNRLPLQAIGYRQVVEYLRGERTLEETIDLVKTRTRQFAKRQMTWFRNQHRVQWIDAEHDVGANEIADRIERLADNDTGDARQ
jgi:tRNA dimethylallyltransferase